MRLIDIAVFMLIFEVVGNLIVVSYSRYFGFGGIPLITTNVGSDIQSQQASLWENVQTVATAALMFGVVGGALLSAVFGQYYLSLMIAVAGIVINFIPQLKVYVMALPTILTQLGIPAEISFTIITIYNLLLMLALLMWMSGKGY
jgi:hypothetical protein